MVGREPPHSGRAFVARAQPLNSVTFREPHTYFKDLLFALESSSQILRLHPMNSSMHCWELPGFLLPSEKAGLVDCIELPGFWGGGGRGQSKGCASTASSVREAPWVTVASRVQWQCWVGGEGCVRITALFLLLFNLHPLPSPLLWSSLSC